MNKIAVLSLLFSLIISIQCAGLYDKTSNVIQLTASDFEQQVYNSPHVWMVEFYAPWCGHCKNLAPVYEAAATNLKGIAKIAAINCDEHQSFCGQFGVKGFPTLKVFAESKTTKGKPLKNPEDYNGERSTAAIVDFVTKKLPNYVSTDAERFFSESKLGKVILFSDKPKVTTLYKALAIEFKDRLSFIQIQSSNKKFVDQYEVSDFPTLIVENESGDRVKYSGALKADQLIKFLGPYAKPSSSSSNKSEKEALPSLLYIENQASFEENCLSKSGICVVSVLDSEESDTYAANLAVTTELAEKYKKQFRFFYISGPKHPEFVNKLHIDSGFPQFVVLNPSKKSFSQFIGTYNTAKLSTFLDKTLSGSNKRNTQILESIPPLDF